MKNTDRLYWDDQFGSYYVANGMGRTFQDVLDEFIGQYPDFRTYLSEQGTEDIKSGFVKRQMVAYRTADRDEHVPDPVPPHIRDVFLPFHVEVPPLSPSISAFDGQGRLSVEDATPKQHRRHHDGIRKYHKKGAAYREGAVEKWTAMIDELKRRLPEIENPDNLPLREILSLLKKTWREEDSDDRAASGETAPLT